jgi:RNA polymerase sigma-70 factor (ECF subfamily)
MNDTSDDHALMAAYRGGDANAFEILYRRHKGPVYRYLLRQCNNPAIAEEIFHEAWLGLIKAKDRYEPTAKFTTYLYHLAHNRLIDYYRRQAAGIPISYDDDPDPLMERQADVAEHEPENELDRQRLAKKLLGLIADLPDAQREAFLLREEAGMSIEEIAVATGVNAETAKSRLRYAVAKLRSGMQATDHRGNAVW